MYLISLLFCVFCVAFTTLLERKFIGLSQYRISVNKIFIVGIFQPLVDGVKLLLKSLIFPLSRNSLLWFLRPSLLFIVCYLLWQVCFISYMIIFSCWFLCVAWFFGMTIFGTILRSLRSRSGFSLLGASRCSCQTVCFELVFFIILSSILYLMGSISQIKIISFFIILIFWIPTIICELIRSPLDLPEGERELVRGYNIEYSSSGFVLLFLREYSNLFVIRFIRSLLIFDISLVICISLFSVFIFIRSVYVRIKLDSLINLIWFLILPISIFWLRLIVLVF